MRGVGKVKAWVGLDAHRSTGRLAGLDSAHWLLAEPGHRPTPSWEHDVGKPSSAIGQYGHNAVVQLCHVAHFRVSAAMLICRS